MARSPAGVPATTGHEKRLRVPAWLSVLILLVSGLVVPVLTAPAAHAFGTINGLGQRAEHERITRAALACPPGVKSDGSCFEPRSIDQVAGHSGTFGAVGSPDSDEFNNPAAHCDDADFLNVSGYPQSRAAATTQLLACVAHLRQRITQGITAANGLLDADGELIGKEVDLKSDCTFTGGVAGRAKCNAIEGFGRALHGAQDFYSHSNWADSSDATRPIGTTNPPGLNLAAPSPILDLAGTSSAPIPTDLTTGFFAGIFSDTCKASNTRVTHACLNKDKALINTVSGAATDPKTPRGLVGTNEQKAVSGAIAETRRQWADFRARLVTAYGADKGNLMILAIAQDVPKIDVVFAIDTTGSMFPYISAAVSAANVVLDSLSGRGTPARLADYRIGVVDYKDVDSTISSCPPDYDAVTDLAFASKRQQVVNALGTLPGKVSGGCDIPEDVLSGIQRAVNFPWRDGVTKAIIAMGDAPGHDPEAHSGLTSVSVIAAANAVDPASVYPILVGGDPAATSFLTTLASGTGGQTFDGSSAGVGQALLDALATIINTPPGGDVDPPVVTADFPEPPDGQGGFFRAGQTPVTTTVTATDPSGIAAISCLDSAGGLTHGPLTVTGPTTATVQISISGDGQHLVFCSASDSAGNTGMAPGSTASGVVQIDANPPAMTCSVDPSSLWPPDHRMVPVTATVTADDAVAGPVDATLVSVTSSEGGPDDMAGFTTGTADVTGQLRAERSGSGPGRVYTLTYGSTDPAGNTGTCAATVTVAHDQGH